MYPCCYCCVAVCPVMYFTQLFVPRFKGSFMNLSLFSKFLFLSISYSFHTTLTHSSIQGGNAQQTSVEGVGCGRALTRCLQLLTGPAARHTQQVFSWPQSSFVSTENALSMASWLFFLQSTLCTHIYCFQKASIIQWLCVSPHTSPQFCMMFVFHWPVDGADSGGEVFLQFGDEALCQTLDTGLVYCLWDRHKHTLNTTFWGCTMLTSLWIHSRLAKKGTYLCPLPAVLTNATKQPPNISFKVTLMFPKTSLQIWLSKYPSGRKRKHLDQLQQDWSLSHGQNYSQPVNLGII